jgi:hypothetical protein
MAKKQREPERLAGRTLPFRLYARHHPVSVYTGTGWKPGTVVHCDKDRCSVALVNERRTVVCYDARNIRERSAG